VRAWSLAVAAALAAPVLLHPPALNQGVYLYVGRLILEGGVPYRDVFEPKGPLLYAVYAVMQAALPAGWVPGVLQLLTAIGAGGLAGHLAGRRAGPGAGLLAAGFAAAALPAWSSFAGAPASPLWSGEAEDLTTALGLGAVVLLEPRGGSRPKALGAGLLLGLGLVTKQTHVFVAGAVILGLGRVEIRRAALAAVAAALPVALVAVLFAALGAGSDLWTATVAWPLFGYGGVDAEAGWARAAGAALDLERVRLLGLAGVGVLAGRGRAKLGLVELAFVGALFSALLQGRGWPYHFEPALGFGAVLAAEALAPGLARLERRFPRLSHPPARAAAAVGLAALVAAGSPRGYAAAWRRVQVALLEGPAVARAAFTDTAATEAELEALARHLRARAEPSDGLFVWGMHARLHLDTGLAPPGRFVFALPLAVPGRLAERFRAEEARAFAARPPRFVLYTAAPGAPAAPPPLGAPAPPPSAGRLLWDGRALVPRFSELHARLRARYRRAARFGRLVLLERRAGRRLESRP
jgi:hypothetical protein